MSCPVEYPKEAPIDCIREVARIVRGGRIAAERSALAKHLWSVQGYVQRLTLGEPRPLIGAHEPCGDATALLALETLERQALAQAEGAVQQALPIPLAVLLEWLIQKLLDALRR
jgi:hypothetical protein